ncbi:hypothetical protein [Bosea sp. TAF32]|uniref:hypothetical protein n=1 Tax=Bosea sp. TAF32 TaxID=3237482 RepID=UPI003F902F80
MTILRIRIDELRQDWGFPSWEGQAFALEPLSFDAIEAAFDLDGPSKRLFFPSVPSGRPGANSQE